MVRCYRIVYGLVVAVFLGNILKTDYFFTAPLSVAALTAGLFFGLFVLLIGFYQIRPAISLAVVIGWEAFFIWYGWFSPSSPFVLHELHTLDPSLAAHETRAHLVEASALFALLFTWFLSLPIVQLGYFRHERLGR